MSFTLLRHTHITILFYFLSEIWNCRSLINIELLQNHGSQQIINIYLFNENTSLEFQNIVVIFKLFYIFHKT